MPEKEKAHQYVTEVVTSEITGISIQKLRNDRWLRRGIPYVKVGRSVRYAVDDIVDFMNSHKIVF